MDVFNHFVTVFFDFVLKPFEGLQPFYGLLFLSFLSGVFLLKLFGMVSNQKAIQKTKDKIQAHILEIVLYQNQLGLSMRGMLRTLRANVAYLKHALLPLVVLTVPCVIILAQLYIRYDHRPLKVGEETTVEIVADPTAGLDEWALSTTDGLEILGPPFKIKARGEATWRLKALADGKQTAILQDGGRRYEKNVYVGESDGKIVPGRFRQWFQSLLHPGEKRLDPNSKLKAITVTYPEITHDLFHIKFNWLVLFLIVSVAGGWLLRGALKVSI